MNVNPWPLSAAIALCFAGVSLASGQAHAQAINGAIFTTTVDHSVVNGNIYPNKEAVYLNGGPNNRNCNGGKLPDGDYYFQVTDPSGKTLLSTVSAPSDRSFRVVGGVIARNLGDTDVHPDGGISHCGSLAIRLFPYNDTPNPGGVYKVWITRVSSFEAACGVGVDCGLDGFVPRSSKTDNFKVRHYVLPPVDPEEPEEPEDPPQTWIKAFKFYDANANGYFDEGEELLNGWEFNLSSESMQVDSTGYSSYGMALWPNMPVADDYFVAESLPFENNWVHSGTLFSGHDGSAMNPAGPLLITEPGGDTRILFGNYCTVPSSAEDLGFWKHTWHGANAFPALAPLLPELWARDSAGNHVFVNYALMYQSDWAALSPYSSNLAHRLSAEVVSLYLNILSGRVDGGFHHADSQMSAQALADAANLLLSQAGYVGVADSQHPMHASMSSAYEWVKQINDGSKLVPTTPCQYTFY